MSNFEKFLKWEAATRDTVDFKTIYVDMAGDLVAGLMLSQIMFWHLPDKKGQTKLRVVRNDKAWIAKAHNQWYEEVRITEGQAKRAVGILKAKGIIETAVYRFNGTPMMHIRIVGDGFFKAWNDELDRRESTRPTELVDKVETTQFLTETTSETTTEIMPDSPVGEAAPKRRAAPKDPLWSHPAIKAVQAVKDNHQLPPRGARDRIIKILGEHPDIEKLRACWTEWSMQGYKPTSWKWLEEWYPKGIPARKPSTGSGYKGGNGLDERMAILQRRASEEVTHG